MRRCHHLLASYGPMLAVVAVLIATPRVSSFAVRNLVLQALLFTAVAAIPALRTWQLLVTQRGWTPEQYEQWVGDTSSAQLLSEPSAGSRRRRRPSERAR